MLMRLAGGLLLFAQTFPAIAQDCKLSSIDNFGAVAIGEGYDKIPKNFVRHPDCEVSAKFPNARCGWTDGKTGIKYEGWEGFIFRKQIDISAANPRPALPFGLTTQDKIQEVVSKIKALDNAPDLQVWAPNNDHFGKINSAGCLKSSRADSMWLEAEFGADGRLKTFFVSSPTN